MKKLLFYLSFTLVIMHNMFRTVSFIDVSIFNVIYGVALMIFAFLGILNIHKANAKKILFTIFITIFLAIFTIIFHDLLLITIWLAIIAFKGMDFEKTVKYDLILKIICLLAVILLYGLGLTKSGTTYDGSQAISGMGFENPNVFSAYMMSIVIDALYLRRKKINLLDLILVSVLSAFIVIFVGSRTQPIVMISTTIFLLFYKNKRHHNTPKKGVLKLIGCNLFGIMACISLIIVGVFINNPSSQIMQGLDTALSGRLRISARIIDNYGVDLIGNDSFTKDVDEATIDNQYTYITIMYGIIPLIIISIIMYKYMDFLDTKQRKEVYIIMCMFIISGLVEKSCLRIQYNIFILYSAYMVYGDTLLRNYKNKAIVKMASNDRFLSNKNGEANE